MANAILIKGYLDPTVCQRAYEEIEHILQGEAPDMLRIVIDSKEGGSLKASSKLASLIRGLRIPTTAEIHSARAAAAIIAIATTTREMTADGILEFHLGVIKMEAVDALRDPEIFNRMVAATRGAKKFIMNFLVEKRLPLGLIRTLDASGRLTLDSAQCLESGIVSRIIP